MFAQSPHWSSGCFQRGGDGAQAVEGLPVLSDSDGLEAGVEVRFGVPGCGFVVVIHAWTVRGEVVIVPPPQFGCGVITTCALKTEE